jgi:ribosomal protein L44E
MGQEIVYCSVCGERILESHFKRGKAVTILKKNYCPKCAKEVIKTGQKAEEARPASEPPSPRKLETRRIPFADRPKPLVGKFPIPMPFMIAIGVGVLALLLLFLVLSRSGR